MRSSSSTAELGGVRRPILIVVVLGVLAAAAHVGFRLAGALSTLHAIALVGSGTRPAAIPAAAAPAPRTGAIMERASETPEPPVSEAEPYARFDAEAAAREAADRDPNVADLLNDPDPDVGGAVRDFFRSLDRPGDN